MAEVGGCEHHHDLDAPCTCQCPDHAAVRREMAYNAAAHEKGAPLLTEVLTLSDEALVCFVDFVRLNDPRLTRNPAIIRRVFTAYLMSDAQTAEATP